MEKHMDTENTVVLENRSPTPDMPPLIHVYSSPPRAPIMRKKRIFQIPIISDDIPENKNTTCIKNIK
jgi:hypothetical protein